MMTFATIVSLSMALMGAEAADEPRGEAARAQAAKACEVYLHDGLEALTEGRRGDAERWLKQARAAAETVGPESIEMARALGGLGALALGRKEYAEAESLLTRSLAIKEKALGPDDALVGLALHNLAVTRVALKRYDEAEPTARRAVAIREKAPDADDEDLADSLDLLALIHVFRGDIPRSEEVFRRAVAVREKLQGPEHPDLAKALINMASARASRALSGWMDGLLKSAQEASGPAGKERSEADFRAAEAMMERALAIREKALGPDSPDTLDTIEELAGLYVWHDDHARAEGLLRRLLAAREKALGPDDPRVAETLATLAGSAMDRGQYREAEPLLRRAVAIAEKARRARPDDAKARETEEEYARDLRRAIRSAEVMADPALRPTEDDLAYLNGLEYASKERDVASLFNSRHIQVLDDAIGDAGLVHLRGLVNAERLNIGAQNITDAGLAHLEHLTGLKELVLIGSKVRGPGLAHLKGMADLEDLNLGASFLLDDAGLTHLPPLPRLKTLNLDHAAITDAALAHLERLPALSELNVDGTKVSAEAIERFQRTHPGLKIAHTKRFPLGAPLPKLLEPPAPPTPR